MECVFCHKEKLVTDIIYEDELVMAFMDMEPINEGHVLLVPKSHYLDVDEINVKILKYAEEHVDATGLGTTCVCSIITDDFLLFGNVGDSSGYVLKNGKLYKVTRDHTLVNILLENGELTESAAKTHPQKNVLMKALGASEEIEMDIFDVEKTLDGVLLCSDGLTNMVSVEQMEKILGDEDLELEEQVGKMIMKANMRGGTDNITVACVRFGGE